MKELIERLRFQARYTHGVVPVTMAEAADALEQQAAVIEQMREALHRCTKFTQEDYDAMELQPCPEVLNKIRADAVRKFAEAELYNPYYSGAMNCADRIEKGEA